MYLSIIQFDENIVLKGDPICIVSQNINCFMCGKNDIWKKFLDNLRLELESNNYLEN